MSNEVTSVGGLGQSERSYGRMYWSFESAIETYSPVRDTLFSFFENNLGYDGIDRFVFRSLFSKEAFEDLCSDDTLSNKLEVAVPLTYSGGESEWLVYLAQNHGKRAKDNLYVKEMVESIEKAKRHTEDSIVASIENLNAMGIGEVTLESTASSLALYGLWGETFEWTEDGCQQFTNNLETQIGADPALKSRWFGGLAINGELVSCAMAERLDIPSTVVGSLALIENTEWATTQEFRGMGLGSIVINSLDRAIKNDLKDVDHLLFAECNIISGAHVVAHKVGYKAPATNVGEIFVPQVLVQNVKVGDNIDTINEYRDFAFLVLQ